MRPASPARWGWSRLESRGHDLRSRRFRRGPGPADRCQPGARRTSPRRAESAAAGGRAVPRPGAADRRGRRFGQDERAHPTHRRAASRAGRRGRARSWRSRSPTRPPPRCASASRTWSGRRADGMWISTFHSACVRILRRQAEAMGMTGRLHDLRHADSRALIKRVAARARRRHLGLHGRRRREPHLEPQERARRRRHLRPHREPRRPEGGRVPRGVPAIHGGAAARQRARLRRPDRRDRAPVPRLPRGRGAVSAAVPACARRRVPGHQPRPVRAHPRAGAADQAASTCRKTPACAWMPTAASRPRR